MTTTNEGNQRDELAQLVMMIAVHPDLLDYRNGDYSSGAVCIGDARRIADKAIAAGYRKSRTITTVEKLDALPEGSVVISPEYRHYRNGMQVSFQKWDDGRWYRGGRGRDTHSDYFLPATVLYEPGAEATQ